MGFFTTYIVMIILAYLSHYFYHKFGVPKGKSGWIAWYSMLVVVGLMAIDIAIYVGVFDFIFPLLNNIPWVNIENGRDFMWNSFQLFGIDFGVAYNDPGLNSIAILLFLSYPTWFSFSKLTSRMMFGGHKSYEEGYWWAFKPTKRPKEEEFMAKPPEGE